MLWTTWDTSIVIPRSSSCRTTRTRSIVRLAPGTRPRLDSGRLGVVVIDAPGTSPLPGRAWTATSVEVHGPAPVHAGIDGEAVDLSTPLDFEILPAALRVRISARHPGVSPSGVLP